MGARPTARNRRYRGNRAQPDRRSAGADAAVASVTGGRRRARRLQQASSPREPRRARMERKRRRSRARPGRLDRKASVSHGRGNRGPQPARLRPSPRRPPNQPGPTPISLLRQMRLQRTASRQRRNAAGAAVVEAAAERSRPGKASNPPRRPRSRRRKRNRHPSRGRHQAPRGSPRASFARRNSKREAAVRDAG